MPPDRTLLSIGLAAVQLGVHPQTLREYERQGLVTPQRTPGGTRRYGVAELDRLRRVQRLTAEGLSLAGVRYVLDVEDELERMCAYALELEQRLGIEPGRIARPPQRRAGSGRTASTVTRSMSLELVHVPRPRRGPRWRNED